MKENIYIQNNDNEQEISFVKNQAKKDWKTAGNLVKDIKTIDYYVKANENTVYYLINGEFDGSVALY